MPLPDGREYEHRLHAGNVGDVLKHAALALLLARRTGPTTYIDTHAGAGEYALGPTGEWTEGIGRLSGAQEAAPPNVRAWLEPALKLLSDRRRYAGSPRVAERLLGPGDQLELTERSPPVHAALEAALRGPRVRIALGDGLERLSTTLAAHAGRERIVLCDPPFADRSEWQIVPRALAAASRAHPSARFCLWYPVKSYARPNAMLAELGRSGIRAEVVELITTPLSKKKNRLNGSGLLLIGAPPGLIEELSALAAWLGPRLATQAGYWSTRCVGFGPGFQGDADVD